VFVFDPLAVLLLIAANMTLSKPKEPTKKIEAATVNEINDDWTTSYVEIDVDEDLNFEDYDKMYDSVVNQNLNFDPEKVQTKDELKKLLKQVDKKLIDMYTTRNSIDHKHEKRSLQRIKAKIINKLNEMD
jgi:succinate dehydrogenase flavin-adding protein (antitoxin of CptAB toxin-antitoxin module)